MSNFTHGVTAEPKGQSLAQKIIAKAAGVSSLRVGEIVNCAVDLAMFHDSSGPRRLEPMLQELNAKIWDPQKVVLVMDHYVPERDADSRQILQITRDVARQWKLPHVIDSQGICHVVLPERGHLKPGMFCVGGDSHSPTGGAFGCYMFGIGATEMLGVVITGEIWLQVPKTIEMNWSGQLAPGVMAKDMMLYMIAQMGLNGGEYQALEFTGDTVKALSMRERMTLSNLSAEMGAQAGLVAADEVTLAYLRQAGVGEAELEALPLWASDAGSADVRHAYNASTLAPQVAAPHSPANTKSVLEYTGVNIDIAYIGACTGAKLDDLRAAASVLKGQRIHPKTRLMVAPASAHDQRLAKDEGVMQILIDAGAEVLPNSCGACAGYGATFEENMTVMSSTARNFKARMGPASVQVFLGSPYTVAASALRGKITDVREMLA
jgi:3-isopropylmalate/(R)-2-methylmalate dehydratase large subunit